MTREKGWSVRSIGESKVSKICIVGKVGYKQNYFTYLTYLTYITYYTYVMDSILSLLNQLSIPFSRFDHKAVFTCAESEGLHVEIPGAHTKQLLMKGKRKKQYVLAIVMHDKRVDTKTLAKEFGDQSMSFVSPEELKRLLGVEPGSVTPFGLIYDKVHEITVIVDEDAWRIGRFRFHPLTNTATLVIDRSGFETFMNHTGHTWSVGVIPNREQAS